MNCWERNPRGTVYDYEVSLSKTPSFMLLQVGMLHLIGDIAIHPTLSIRCLQPHVQRGEADVNTPEKSDDSETSNKA
jgi:hypothetical protein